MQQVLRLSKSRILSLEGRKYLLFLKLFILHFWLIDRKTSNAYMALLTSKNLSQKICNNFESCTRKRVDISWKIVSLQCSWLRILCDENFHEWKIIPSHLINKYFGKSLKFYLCPPLIINYLLNVPKFTETSCFNGIALCLLLPNYLLEFC